MNTTIETVNKKICTRQDNQHFKQLWYFKETNLSRFHFSCKHLLGNFSLSFHQWRATTRRWLKLHTWASGKNSARQWDSCVFPENGGPQITILHGAVGCGGSRYGLGFFMNFSSALALDSTYILSRNLSRTRKKCNNSKDYEWTGYSATKPISSLLTAMLIIKYATAVMKWNKLYKRISLEALGQCIPLPRLVLPVSRYRSTSGSVTQTATKI